MSQERPLQEFTFGAAVAVTIKVIAPDGANARQIVGEALDGSRARLLTGSGTGLELAHLRVTGDVHLVAIDGLDPVQALEADLADLRKHRKTRDDT